MCEKTKYLNPAFFTFQARSPRTLRLFPYTVSTIRVKYLERLYMKCRCKRFFKPYKNSYDIDLVISYFLLSNWNCNDRAQVEKVPSLTQLDIILVPRVFGYCRKTRDPWGREEREIADQLIVATHVLIKWNVRL